MNLKIKKKLKAATYLLNKLLKKTAAKIENKLFYEYIVVN